ncbi:O-antigen ligase family protein [Pedobacter sp. 22226]|uniref:O-antigen ligase family protein n=1 Tax=Pedobacter sp. 22226 TaxID=3453894 RepID=UPI003F82720F
MEKKVWKFDLKYGIVFCLVFLSGFYYPSFIAKQYQPLVFSFTMVLVALYLTTIGFMERHTPVVNLIDFTVITFVLYNCLLTIASGYSTGFIYDKDVNLYLSYLIFYWFVKRLLSKNSLGFIAEIICFLGLLIMGQFWIGFLMGHPYYFNGLLGNSGIMAGFLVVSIPLALSLLGSAKEYFYLPLFYSCFALATVIVSGSRTALAALVFTILFCFLFLLNKMPRLKNIIIAGTCFLIFVVAMYAIRPGSFNGRLLIWKVGSYMVDADIFIGKGLGFVEKKYNGFQEIYFSSAIRSQEEKLLAGDTHSLFNEPYRILIESGITGLLFFGYLIAMLFKVSLNKDFSNNKVFLFGVALAILIVFGLCSYPFQTIPVSLLFFTISAVISSVAPESFRQRFVFGKVRLKKMLFALPLITVLLMSKWIYERFSGLKQWQLLKKGAWEYNEAYAWGAYQKLEQTLANESLFLSDYGLSLQHHSYYQEAQPLLNRAVVLSPSAYNYIQAAYNYTLIDKKDTAEIYYKKAINAFPKMFTAKYAMFQLYIEWGRQQQAKELALDILNSPIKVPSKEVTQIRAEALLYLKRTNALKYTLL